jgi:hypothetical protein
MRVDDAVVALPAVVRPSRSRRASPDRLRVTGLRTLRPAHQMPGRIGYVTCIDAPVS